jgi:predicted small secreted protein
MKRPLELAIDAVLLLLALTLTACGTIPVTLP